jgi:hypothetical protein
VIVKNINNVLSFVKNFVKDLDKELIVFQRYV